MTTSDENDQQYELSSIKKLSSYEKSLLTHREILKITKDDIKKIHFQLGLIDLSDEQIEKSKINYKNSPENYRSLTSEEKVLLWHAENFRRQFHVVYPSRKPLLLVLENECGIQVSH